MDASERQWRADQWKRTVTGIGWAASFFGCLWLAGPLGNFLDFADVPRQMAALCFILTGAFAARTLLRPRPYRFGRDIAAGLLLLVSVAGVISWVNAVS